MDIAAYRSLQAGAPVRAANAYIGRFWLGARFYFVSTGYCLTPLCILHLPGQAKARQLVLLYRYYARRGHFPPDATVWRWCGLPAARPAAAAHPLGAAAGETCAEKDKIIMRN